MDAKDNKASFYFGVPGLVLQIAANRIGGFTGLVLGLVGTVLFIIGLGYYARAKGYSMWFGALGFLSCLGWLILALLPDHRK